MQDIKERFIDLDITGKSSGIRTVTSQKIIINEPLENYPNLLNENDGFYNKVYKNDQYKISPITTLLKNVNSPCHTFSVLTLSLTCDILENNILDDLKFILILKTYVQINPHKIANHGIGQFLKNIQFYLLLDRETSIQIDEEIKNELREDVPNLTTEIVHLKININTYKEIVSALEISFRLVSDGEILLERKLQKEQHTELIGFYKAVIDYQFNSDYLKLESINFRRNKFLLDDQVMFSTLGLLSVQDELKEIQLLAKKVEQQNQNSKSDSSCFIVTATMNNDPLNVVVQDFRKYRDKYLINTYKGKLFIRIYHIIGPILAFPIKYSKILQKLSYKYFLLPIYDRIKHKI